MADIDSLFKDNLRDFETPDFPRSGFFVKINKEYSKNKKITDISMEPFPNTFNPEDEPGNYESSLRRIDFYNDQIKDT